MRPTPKAKNPNSTTSNGRKSAGTSFDELVKIKDQLGIYSPIALLPGFDKLIAVPFQKILIVNTDDSNALALLQEDNQTTLDFIPVGSSNPIPLPVRVVRVCEYPNPDDEYHINGIPIPTNTVLIEWQKSNRPGPDNAPFITFINGQKGIIQNGQIDNLIVQDPPNNQPGPPIVTASEEIPPPDGFVVGQSDFNTILPLGAAAASTDPIVAVLDTGIKTRFKYDDGTINGIITTQYPDSSLPSRMRSFKLAPAAAGVLHQHGYSPITNYLRASSNSNPAAGADKDYRDIPTLSRVHLLTKAQILNSPYDDHLLTKGSEVRGRHGTTNSAIINQKSRAAVLPVKILNHGGQGTLYDLLCGLNYVLSCHQNGLLIRVVNLSLAGQLHYDAYQLLRSKFRALHEAGIWAVAAAGNRKITADETSRRELKVNTIDPNFDPSALTNNQEVWNLFPACFARDPNLSVLTVTTVQESPYGVVPLYLRSAYLFWALIGALLRVLFGLFKLPKNGIVSPVYKTVNNYGKSSVSVGVIEPLEKVFANANSGLNTTSFATAFFSAKLADYLADNPTANRLQILDGLTFRGEILSNDEIADNRLIRYE
jgi:hypothetical protein